MTSLTTLSDGDTYADIRLGETFIVSVDRSEDGLSIRVFDPDKPETAIGEHRFDLSPDGEIEETTVETHTGAGRTANSDVALG